MYWQNCSHWAGLSCGHPANIYRLFLARPFCKSRPVLTIFLISLEAVDALKAGRINCVVQCTPHLGPAVMELVAELKAGRELPKVNHPDEGAFSDFDDLTDPKVEGF